MSAFVGSNSLPISVAWKVSEFSSDRFHRTKVLYSKSRVAAKHGDSNAFKMTSPSPMVFVIADDESVRKGLRRLLRSADYASEVLKGPADFLARARHAGPTCAIC